MLVAIGTVTEGYGASNSNRIDGKLFTRYAEPPATFRRVMAEAMKARLILVALFSVRSWVGGFITTRYPFGVPLIHGSLAA